ncbi:MAG: protein kinase [Myxococcales bacterium]|nr:protein kinase [Myxococcales bacterium]
MLRGVGTALLLAVLGFVSPAFAEDAASGAPPAPEPIAVAAGNASPELAGAHEGFAEWVRDQLGASGVPVRSGLEVRRALPPRDAEHPAQNRSTKALLEALGRVGAERALLVDLRLRDGTAEAVFRLHDVDSAALLGARRATGPVTEIAQASGAALAQVATLVGAETTPSSSVPAVPISDLAAMTRSLAAFDRGRAADAWRELGDAASAPARRLRERIEAAVQHPKAPLHEKARILAATGDAAAVWDQIEGEARAQVSGAKPARVDTLVAAGEVASALGDADSARTFFETATRLDASDADAQRGIAKVLEQAGDTANAVRALERAVEAEPDDIDAKLELARLTPDAGERAAVLLDAGDRASARLDVDAAQLYYESAVEADANVEGVAAERAAGAHSIVGDHLAARAALERSIEVDGATSPRLRALAKAHRVAGEVEAAYQRYNEALGLDDSDSVTLRELGELYADAQRSDSALPYIENAAALSPDDPRAARALAKLLHQRGDAKRSLEYFDRAVELGGAEPEDLREMAAVQRELGQPEAARLTLEGAVDLDPVDAAIRTDLATTYELTGDAKAASEQRAVALALEQDWLDGIDAKSEVAVRNEADLDASRPISERFAALVHSFGRPRERVALLGVAEERDAMGEARQWLWPFVADVDAIEAELLAAIGASHGVVATPRIEDYLVPLAEDALEFDSPASLRAGAIADLNIGLATDAVFVARIARRERGTRDMTVCGTTDFYEVEVRLLEGSDEAEAAALSNVACIPDGVAAYASLNLRALAIYALFVALVVYPFARGWGRVVVRVKLPPKTKALFSISLSKTPRKLKEVTEPANGSARYRIEKSLKSLNRYERPLDPDKPTVFNMIPARRRAFYVTLRGPLLDHATDELVGNFLESQQVVVTRGRTTEVEFDLAPNEAAIQVSVFDGKERAKQAIVTVAGRRNLTRYLKEESAFLYLGEGEHTIVVSDRNRVAERTITVVSFDPQTIEVDLSREHEVYFTGCPPAAMHYLEGDYAAAADALERAGQEGIAHEIRARWLTRTGRVAEATRELEAAGQHDEAARLRAAHAPDEAGSGELYEQAGDFAMAAQQYERAGDRAAAARAYEAAYDYENAMECYRELGEIEKVIELLEKTSDYLEAGRVAYDAGQLDRAVYDFQQCDKRHLNYTEVCRLLARVLIDKGELDVAAAKIEEAIALGGEDSCPIDLHQRYAEMLEELGRVDEALAAWEAVRRRDLTRPEANTRIEALRKEKGRIETAAATQLATAAAPAAAPAVAPTVAESRYEVIQELGRGGMGVVFKARDKHLGRVVALKQLTENLKDHPTAVQFFEREARSAAALNHPNIVTIYDAGQENGTYFISMEFMEGTPLDAILKKHGAIKPAIVARLATQIAAGLDYAHRNKIIHRDIKTANLFFTKDKIVKIMDFGLAKMVEEVRRGATVIGGTPYYMAPEQATGENVDHRADLYAFGVTLFQLLTGAVPFAKGDVTYHHRHTAPPDPRGLVADIPDAFAETILALMAKDPADRIQTAAEVGRVFQAWIESGAKG